jgi:hypothetical protein
MSVIVHVSGKSREDAESRFASNGTEMLSWKFAKNVGTKDKPEFNNFRATLFGAQATALKGKILKDTKFSVTGKQKITQHEYEGKMYVTAEINVMDFEFAGEAPKQEEKPQEDEEQIPF